ARRVAPRQPVTAPRRGAPQRGARPPAPPRTATADAPTEVTTAPTTPIPRAGIKIPSAQKKRSGVGMLVGAIVVVAAGVGGYLAIGRKPAAGLPSAPPPLDAKVETVRVI